MKLKIGLTTLSALSTLAAFSGCGLPPSEDGAAETIEVASDAVLTSNSNYVASVTGSVVIKAQFLVTQTLAQPRIPKGSVAFGPTPESCATRSDGVRECKYTMVWRGVTVDPFTVNGKTIRDLTIDSWAPAPVTVVGNKFTIPANTARFTLTGTTNGSPFLMNRTMDSPMTGTFTPNGAFTIAGTVTRTISGPIGTSIKTWGNFNLAGTALNKAPTCRATGGNRYSCETGGRPAGTCKPTKVHRTVFQCNGSNKSIEEVIDLSNGYSNYTCSNRFVDHCISDGTFDSYYSEWCEFSCVPSCTSPINDQWTTPLGASWTSVFGDPDVETVSNRLRVTFDDVVERTARISGSYYVTHQLTLSGGTVFTPYPYMDGVLLPSIRRAANGDLQLGGDRYGGEFWSNTSPAGFGGLTIPGTLTAKVTTYVKAGSKQLAMKVEAGGRVIRSGWTAASTWAGTDLSRFRFVGENNSVVYGGASNDHVYVGPLTGCGGWSDADIDLAYNQ